jgi:hypothetical protein
MSEPSKPAMTMRQIREGLGHTVPPDAPEPPAVSQPEPAVDRIPVAHSFRYVARGLPDLPYQYGRGVLRGAEITLTYRAAPDSQLGRVHAYVAGRLWVDEAEIPHAPYGQHYDSGLGSWPDWLAEEARLHDPEAPPAVSSPAPVDRAALVAGAIRSFPFDNFGMDDVSFALEDDPDAQEWVPALADAVLRRLAGEARDERETQAETAPIHDPGVVAYRSEGGHILRCLRHYPDDETFREGDLHPVTAEDLEDGGICTYSTCGADVLIPQQPEAAEGAQQ